MLEVSVIVPVYKVEPYLRQCVDSVLAQTFTDFELILIDDGSPDNCGAICDEYATRDGRIRVIHQENAGQGKARNVGMDMAVGKYIIFLDSDDYWLPSTLEMLYAEAERNQTQVLAFGAIPIWDGIEEPERHLAYQHTIQNGVVKSGPESLKAALDAGEYYTQPCLRFYRLEYLRETGLHFDEGTIHEDERFSFLAYLLADRVECIEDRPYRRRYRAGSTMTSRSLQNSAHGYRVALDGLLEVRFSASRSEQEELLLERCCANRIGMIIKLYEQAQSQKDRKAARWIQKDGRQTLKRARALPTLPQPLRLATYSLFLNWLSPKRRRSKRLASTVQR